MRISVNKIRFFLGCVCVAFSLGCASSDKHNSSTKNLHSIATDVYLLGLPLVANEFIDRRLPAKNVLLCTEEATDPALGTIDTLTMDTRGVVARLDVTDQAFILRMPAIKDRFYSFSFFDSWTNVFAHIGSREPVNEETDFLLVGPSWDGQVPPRTKLLRSPTNLLSMVGRLQLNGPKDVARVNALQKKIRLFSYKSDTLQPLSPFLRKHKPNTPKSMTLPVSAEIDKLSADEYFALLHRLLKANPLNPLDAEMNDKIKALGLANEVFTPSQEVKDALSGVVVRAGVRMQTLVNKLYDPSFASWRTNPKEFKIGELGKNYTFRAFVAKFYIGSVLPEDTTYYQVTVDTQNKPLKGNENYVLKFDKDSLPPVNAFWSITTYGQFGKSFRNEKVTIGSRYRLVSEPDGAVKILVQASAPSKPEAVNWLAIPKNENFSLIMRLFLPKETVLSREWSPPGVERTSSPDVDQGTR